MRNLIGLKEFRQKAAAYIREVSRGKSFLVVRRSKPVFRIVPPGEEDESWETVVNFTKFYKNGVPARELLKRLRALNGGSR